jgi:hypothetical protein
VSFAHAPRRAVREIDFTSAVADAEHFLSRLRRLEQEHVELALRLYYDHDSSRTSSR